jgi:D-alanyl-lipoteichoic acid acyltransferase DltB (MBOAT superfamily)
MMLIAAEYSLVAIIASAVVVLCIPATRRPSGYLALELAVASVVYQRQIFGYLLWIVMVFAFARVVEGVTPLEAKLAKKRWSYACGGMIAVVAIFFAGSMHLLDWVSINAFGVLWTLPDHDMWLLLRTITFLWEFGSGRLKKLNFIDYAIWITFPFTLLGPLIRPSEFSPQYGRDASEQKTIRVVDSKWWRKLLLAIAQMTIGAGLVCATLALDRMGRHWLQAIVLFGTAPWSMYLSSAGLFHLMECLAVFWAIELPPSFNYPFGQPNISEFWARWNMTIVRVCRDYLFYNRWGFKRVNMYLNLLIVFLAVGLWHSIAWFWGIWGLLHGIGFCVYLWYRNDKEKFAAVRKIGSERQRDLLSRAITYIFVCWVNYFAVKIAIPINRLTGAK